MSLTESRCKHILQPLEDIDGERDGKDRGTFRLLKTVSIFLRRWVRHGPMGIVTVETWPPWPHVSHCCATYFNALSCIEKSGCREQNRYKSSNTSTIFLEVDVA